MNRLFEEKVETRKIFNFEKNLEKISLHIRIEDEKCKFDGGDVLDKVWSYI